MRTLRLVGLLVASALAVMAIAGAASASATVLCQEAASPCSAGKTLPSPNVLWGESSELKFEFHAGSPMMICDSSMEIETPTNVEGKPLTGHVIDLDLYNCEGSYCYPPSPIAGLPWDSEIQTTEKGAGKLKLSDGASNPSVTFEKCNPFNPHNCTWGAAEWNFTIEPGSKPKAVAKEIPLSSSECGTIIVSGEYALEPEVGPLSSSLTVKSPVGPMSITCSSSIIGSGFRTTHGKISSLKLSSCSGSCVSATAKSLPYTTWFTEEKGGDGPVSVGSPSGSSTINFSKCFAFNVECVYKVSKLRSSPGSLYANEEVLKREGGSGLCPAEPTLTVSYSLPSGGFWVEP